MPDNPNDPNGTNPAGGAGTESSDLVTTGVGLIGAVVSNIEGVIGMGSEAAHLGREGDVKYEDALTKGEKRLDGAASEMADDLAKINAALAEAGETELPVPTIDAIPDLRGAPHAGTPVKAGGKPANAPASKPADKPADKPEDESDDNSDAKKDKDTLLEPYK